MTCKPTSVYGLAMKEKHPLTVWRRANRYKVKDVAVMVGCSDSTISQIENGTRPPGPELAVKLVRETGLDIGDFLTEQQIVLARRIVAAAGGGE